MQIIQESKKALELASISRIALYGLFAMNQRLQEMSESLGDLNLLLPGASEGLSQFRKRIFLT